MKVQTLNRTARRYLTVFFVMFAITSGTALAAGEQATTNGLVLSALLVTVLISYVIPIITSLLTRSEASPTVKQVVTAALSAINGFVTNSVLADGSAFFTKEALLLFFLSFISAQVSYGQLWKPHDINSKLAPTKGIG